MAAQGPKSRVFHDCLLHDVHSTHPFSSSFLPGYTMTQGSFYGEIIPRSPCYYADGNSLVGRMSACALSLDGRIKRQSDLHE